MDEQEIALEEKDDHGSDSLRDAVLEALKNVFDLLPVRALAGKVVALVAEAGRSPPQPARVGTMSPASPCTTPRREIIVPTSDCSPT